MLHQHYLHLALEEAKKGKGFCAPNPAVGAIIVKDEKIIATGFHQGAGTKHAEIVALDKIGEEAKGATLYVTLEPCCHFGKTPPCVDEIIRRGIKNVYFAYQDPNSLVNGQGQQKLLDANIHCEKITVPDIDLFYQSYAYWTKTKSPYVTAKLALSLDGKIAGKNGAPVQITGEALQKFTHQQRLLSDAILTTAKTIQIDNPQMNVRTEDKIIAKPIYILDRSLQLTDDRAIFNTAKKIILFHGKEVSKTRLKELQNKNVDCREITDLNSILKNIGEDGIHDVWVEAGGHCFESFLNQKLLNKAFIYLSPKILGIDATSAFHQPSIQLTEAQKINYHFFAQEIAVEFIF